MNHYEAYRFTLTWLCPFSRWKTTYSTLWRLVLQCIATPTSYIIIKYQSHLVQKLYTQNCLTKGLKKYYGVEIRYYHLDTLIFNDIDFVGDHINKGKKEHFLELVFTTKMLYLNLKIKKHVTVEEQYYFTLKGDGVLLFPQLYDYTLYNYQSSDIIVYHWIIKEKVHWKHYPRSKINFHFPISTYDTIWFISQRRLINQKGSVPQNSTLYHTQEYTQIVLHIMVTPLLSF